MPNTSKVTEVLTAHTATDRALAASLTIDAPGLRRTAVQVPRQATLGSSPAATVRIRAPGVSRLHAALETRRDGVWLRDLGSTNGTYVGGMRIESVRLEHGTVLRIGEAEIDVELVVTEISRVLVGPSAQFHGMVGASEAMRELYALIGQAAVTDLPVLVSGETGTGKELVAQLLHRLSPRVSKPLLVVDCGVAKSGTLDVELFGHARGAFTGADRDRPGVFEEADGGTVILDELAELPLEAQAKLLRVIDTGEVRRLGETRMRRVDVRMIGVTHEDLPRRVAEERFREDLYYRLAGASLRVPSLRERRGDVALLVRTFASRPEELSDEVLAELDERPWPGNVRELKSWVARREALGEELAEAGAPAPRDWPRLVLDVRRSSLAEAREAASLAAERAYLVAALEATGGKVAEAAKLAGMDRTYVYRLLQRHGLRNG